MVIYSTLIDAATEHVEIFGKAGSTTIREIKIENPQDSTIVLFIKKVSFFVEWDWYEVYPIIKQKVCERDLSREWICMKTLF